MFQKRCAKNRCQCLGPKFHIRLCRCTPAPSTGVARVTGQQAETSLTLVRSTARGVVSGPPVKVSDVSFLIVACRYVRKYIHHACMYACSIYTYIHTYKHT